MISASQLVHLHIGSPTASGCDDVPEGLCWYCGGPLTRGQRVEDFSGASFTGQNRVRYPPGTHVCEACVYVCGRLNPVPGRPPKEGKKFGGNWRNYSHVLDAGAAEYLNFSKGEKPGLLAWLRKPHRGPWFAAIADSGQKHTLPTCVVNPAGAAFGRVLFEETLVALPRAEAWRLVDEMASLLTAGASKEEMGRGEYSPGTWQRCGEAVRAFEASWGGQRHGAFWRLALFLAQRDEEQVQARMEREKQERAARKAAEKDEAKRGRRKTKGTDRGDGALPGRGAKRVPADPGGERPEALGHADREAPAGVSDERQRGGVGDGAGARAQAAGAEQLGLFGAEGVAGGGGRRRRG